MYSGGGPYPDSCTYCLGFTGGIKNEMAELNQIKLTPNPVNDIVTVNSTSELSLITICNSLGEIVLQVHSKNSQEQIDVSKLTRGVYFLKTNNSYGKFIKE